MKNTHTLTLDSNLVARIKKVMAFVEELPASNEAEAINGFILHCLDGDLTMYEDDMILDEEGNVVGDQFKLDTERFKAARETRELAAA